MLPTFFLRIPIPTNLFTLAAESLSLDSFLSIRLHLVLLSCFSDPILGGMIEIYDRSRKEPTLKIGVDENLGSKGLVKETVKPRQDRPLREPPSTPTRESSSG